MSIFMKKPEAKPAAEEKPEKPVQPANEGGEEPMEEFVYHFTGKLNQSQIMKDAAGNPVYEAVCEKITLFKATPFRFCNRLTGEEHLRQIGHTMTCSAGIGENFSVDLSSSFDIDGKGIWEILTDMGYGFRFSLNGLAAHYDVTRCGKEAGFVELAGTGLMNPKYKDNPLGKIPTKGIYRVQCRRRDVEGMFLICLALTRTETTTH